MPNKYEPQPKPETVGQILLRTAKTFYVAQHLPDDEIRRLTGLKGEELDAALAEHGLSLKTFDRDAAMAPEQQNEE